MAWLESNIEFSSETVLGPRTIRDQRPVNTIERLSGPKHVEYLDD